MFRIALCQSNLPVGDIDGNVERLRERIDAAQKKGAELVIFPELSLSGYPPEDLLLKPSFVERSRAAVHELATDIHDLVVLVGCPYPDGDLYNAAAVLANGKVVTIYRKQYLPNYAVFDEQRYFTSGDQAIVIDINGNRIGLTICEDIWHSGGPAQWEAIDGEAQLIVNLSASPYHRTKGLERERMFATRCIDYRCFFAFCNAIGGQDELVFDGHSVVVNPNGEVIARGQQFKEELVVVDLDLASAFRSRLHDPRWQQRFSKTDGHVETINISLPNFEKPSLKYCKPQSLLEPEEEVYRALVLCTTDYAKKNDFHHAILGLSGGIDSALSLAVATDALGAKAVTAISMPSRYTSDVNREDAKEQADRLGVNFLEIPIYDLVASYTDALAEPFANTKPNVSEENLQARIRGNIVMALSNKFNWLVLTTGNKSEMSVGYATLYGDMAGGFSVLKDVLKTWVYRLAEWRNRDSEIILQKIIQKAPSAELRENQLDTDTLPTYDVLDVILEAYVEQDRTPAEIEELGFDSTLVKQVVKMIDRSEYKRRQAPPGIRISTKAFGKDRRLPITNHYR